MKFVSVNVAREYMRDALDENKDLRNSYVENVAVVLRGYGIVDEDRNRAASEIIDLIFEWFE